MTGCDNRKVSQADAVRAMAAKYKFSERTARRYLKRGIDPSALWRCTGADGKGYRFSRLAFRSPLHRPLAIARSNIRRAAKATEFTDADLDLLREIEREAVVLLAAWEAAP